MPDIKIIIATTKKYRMPDDPVYMPLQVGAAMKKAANTPYRKDNTGDNISTKNSSYCELTGIYWAWKNLKADYIGLVHYRRYFASPESRGEDDPFDRIIGGEEVKRLLKTSCIIVPKKRKYYIETLQSHYAHTHYVEQLDETGQVIRDLFPEYMESFERVMTQTAGHMFNMMIMRKDVLDKYCEWLFTILPEVERRFPENNLGAYQGRYIGRIAELIFNVWLDYQVTSGNIPRYQIQELPCVHIETVNWLKKGGAFLAAKIFHKKYGHSF